jgi:hypothetical protein
MQTSEKLARDSNLVALFEGLKFIVIPSTCQHARMEECFKNPVQGLAEKEVCGTMCSHCEHGNTMMGPIHRGALQRRLIEFFVQKCPTPLGLVKYIKACKSNILPKDDVRNKFMGLVHVGRI